MTRKNIGKLSATILLVLIVGLLIYAKGSKKADVPDISDSAVHDYRTVQVTTAAIEETTTEAGTTPNIYEMDVWELGEYLYGISYQDTNRTLRLITYEGYGGSLLSYYVACCCWVRATEGYWGYSNLYQAFGEADTSYDLWMDELGIADWAYPALWECYIDPTYVRYCNGMAEPNEYIYREGNIYVWN